MATTAAILDILIRANTGKAQGELRKLDKSLGSTDKATATTAKNVQKAAGVAGLALTAGLAVAAKAGFGELAEGQKVSAQTAAALRSTKGAANVSQKAIEDLAGAISKKTGIDDEAIQSTQNLLLTFTNIRNEAGRGNKIFDRATKTVQDMSVALGQDGKSSAIQLGKALQDPIKGITALRRVGVNFTDSQKAQIEQLVKSGKTMKAQKLILKELNKEFGGSAEAAGNTLPGQLNKLKNSFDDVAGGLVASLLPVLQTLAGWFSKVGEFLQENPKAAKLFGAALAALAVTLLSVSAATKAARAATVAWSIVTKAATAAQWLLNVALDANPIGLVIIALAALGAAVVVAYKKWETFRKIVDSVWTWLRNAATNTFKWITKAVTAAWDWIKTATRNTWNAVKGALSAVWGAIKTAASASWSAIKTAVMAPIRAAKAALDVVWGNIKKGASTAWDDLKKGFTRTKDALVAAITAPFRVAVSAIGKFIGFILKVVDSIPGVDLKKERASVAKFVEAHGMAKGGAFARTGGMVRKPMVFMGEEAPAHPEFVIPTNPAYRKRARGLLAQAAGTLGFQEGGKWGVEALEGLWNRAGGSAQAAHIMALISTAESGAAGQYGYQFAHNPSGATGLWQILGQLVPGNLYNALVNAKNAVAKYELQGLHAWDASKPVWSRLIAGDANVAGSVVSSAADFIGKLPGVGGLPDWIQGLGSYALSHVKDWIKGQFGPRFPSGTIPPGQSGSVQDAINLAMQMGWAYPSPNQLSGGTHVPGSLHYAGRAVDFGTSGHTTNETHSLWARLVRTFGQHINELFFDEMPWYIDNFHKVQGQFGGHGDHIHIAFRQGGMFGDSPYLGAYRQGGMLPRDGLYYGHQGETVTPAGRRGGPLVHIDKVEVRRQSQVQEVAAALAFRIATSPR